jgi:hypothetical protein
MALVVSSAQVPDTVSFYNLVLFVHISAAIIAFGVTFAYPLVDAALQRPDNRRHLVWWHGVQADVGRKLVTSAATVLLICGIYLAASGPFGFSWTFVTVGLVVVVVLLGLGGAFFAPNERKLAAFAERDIAAAGDGQIVLSVEYERVATRVRLVGITSNILILVAVFVMVTKPA